MNYFFVQPDRTPTECALTRLSFVPPPNLRAMATLVRRYSLELVSARYSNGTASMAAARIGLLKAAEDLLARVTAAHQPQPAPSVPWQFAQGLGTC